MSRQFVHLSKDSDTACKVGKRKSKEPATLIIQAKKAHDIGLTFYKGNDFVWLADSVPPDYIEKR